MRTTSTPNNTLPNLLTSARVAWMKRAPRERKILTIGAIAIVLAAIWSTANWASKQSTALAIALPAAQAQLKGMQEDAAELVRLRARTAPLPIDADQRVETLTAAATERGLVLDIKGDPTGIAVTGTGLSFDSFSQWLAAAHSEGLRVVSMEVLPEGTGVKVSARFAPQSL